MENTHANTIPFLHDNSTSKKLKYTKLAKKQLIACQCCLVNFA